MRTLGALIWKDLIIEARAREVVTAMSLVAFLALVILGLALGPSPQLAAAAAPAAVWVAVSFAATLGLARAHALEQEGRALRGVLLTPVSREALYLGKCGANLVWVLLLQLVVVGATAVLLPGGLGPHPARLALPLALGAVGFTAAGTLLGAMAAETRLREVLLPILLLPVVAPVIILSLAGIDAVLEDRPGSGLVHALNLLGAVDIIFVMLGMWLFAYVVEE